MAKNTYKAEDISILEGLDAVRMRPGMYIGTTSVRGLHHILCKEAKTLPPQMRNLVPRSYAFGWNVRFLLYRPYILSYYGQPSPRSDTRNHKAAPAPRYYGHRLRAYKICGQARKRIYPRYFRARTLASESHRA